MKTIHHLTTIRIIVFLTIAVVLSGCSSTPKNPVSPTENIPTATVTVAPETPGDRQTEAPADTAGETATLSPTDTMREQIASADGLLIKLSLATQFVRDDPTASLPVVKELLSNLDYSTLTPDSANIGNFGPLLIALGNAGEEALVKDTLQRLCAVLPVGVVDANALLADKSTYLVTAEAVMKSGNFDDTVDVDAYWRNVLYQGFATYMAQFTTVDDELAAAKTLSEQIFALFPAQASTDEQRPYKYNAAAPGDGRVWDGKRDDAARLPQLSATPTASPDQKKCLVVFRNDRDGDSEDWYIDLSFMPTLPSDSIPARSDEATIVIAVDTVWKYSGDYYGGIKGYAATTTITAYDSHTGNLIKKLGEVDTPLPDTISGSSDNQPGKYFTPVVDDSPSLSKIGERINAFLAGE